MEFEGTLVKYSFPFPLPTNAAFEGEVYLGDGREGVGGRHCSVHELAGLVHDLLGVHLCTQGKLGKRGSGGEAPCGGRGAKPP